MNVVWLHLRNSPIRWALPVLIVFDLAVLFMRNRYWIGDWPDTGAAALVPADLLGVVGAGAAAWAASAPVRHGLQEQLSAARVHPVVLAAHRLGATVIILLTPYLVGQAVAFAVTARTFPPGVGMWASYAALGVFILLFAVAIGSTCAMLFGPVFAALTAALGYLFLTQMLEQFADFTAVTGPPEDEVDLGSLALRLVAVAVLLVVLLWLDVPSQNRRSRTLGLVPAVLPLIVVMVTTNVISEREPAGEQVTCVQGRTTLCLWPEHEKYLPQIREISALVDQLPDAFVLPTRVNEYGIQKTQYIRSDGAIVLLESALPTFSVLEGSPWSYAGDISIAIAGTTFRFADLQTCTWGNATSTDNARVWAVEAWLEAYLVGEVTPDYQTNAPEEMQEAWARGREIASDTPLDAQLAWAAGEVSDLRGQYCQA